MRLTELRLHAYGPFTDRILDLSPGEKGLHVIFGPNEAGKSSALRALTALLYGVPERTGDTFVHDAGDLRVGGCLQLADGRRLDFVRRKGRKNTLLAPGDGRPVDDALLAPFLPVPAEIFSRLFGIDHRELVEGGEQILQKKGDVGQALFAAAMGSQRFQAVLQAMEDEARNLFRARASTSLVYERASAFSEARRAVKEASLAARDWSEHTKRLEDTQAAIAGLQAQLQTRYRERGALQRVQRILPLVAKRAILMPDVDALGQVVELPEDFGEQRRGLLKNRAEAEQALIEHKAELARLQEELAELAPHQGLLKASSRIEDIVQRLGNHRKSVRDRPSQDGKRQQARNDARELLKGLRPELKLDDVADLRPRIQASKASIQELANRLAGLESEARRAHKALVDLDAREGALQDELKSATATVDLSPLKRAVAEARRHGDLDEQVRLAQREVDKLENRCRGDSAALAPWPVDEGNAQSIAVPVEETIERFDLEFKGLEDLDRKVREDRGRLTADEATIARSLEALSLAGAVPTETDLAQARSHREDGWSLIKRAWLGHEDVTGDMASYDPINPFPQSYEVAVTGGDEVSDRLRREADRVALKAQHLAAQRRITADLETLAIQEAELNTRGEALRADWVRAWEPGGVMPLTPSEMRGWLLRLETLRGHVEQLEEARGKAGDLREKVAGHAGTLKERLRELGVEPPAYLEQLRPILEQADAVVEATEQVKSARDELARLNRERPGAARDADQADEAVSTWRREWTDALQPLGLAGDTGPTVAQTVLEAWLELFRKLDDEAELARRVYGIDKDIEEYEAEVREFVRSIAFETQDADVGRTVNVLNDALKKALADETTRVSLAKQLAGMKSKAEAAEGKLRKAGEGLQQLCRAAGQEHEADLEVAERSSAEARRLRGELGDLERSLRVAGDGMELDDLLREAVASDTDEVPAALAELERVIQGLEEERQRLDQTLGGEKTVLAGMTGESAAADAALKAQEVLATLRGGVERYLRVRTAAVILRKEIERYREANQDPLLVRAGLLFGALTRGSFQSVRTEIGADDDPQLVGLRHGGRLVQVDGMSSGTRDELYLSLRLAALEHFIETTEAMPLIVDDVLINFDDERTRAALEVLADFSKRTQVILFTHHSRIREMAEELGKGCGVFVQDL